MYGIIMTMTQLAEPHAKASTLLRHPLHDPDRARMVAGGAAAIHADEHNASLVDDGSVFTVTDSEYIVEFYVMDTEHIPADVILPE